MRQDRREITEGPQSVYTCHWLDCQRLTGSAFSLAVIVPENGFRLTGIEPRRLQRTADSGRVNTRLVCPECGSWVCGLPRDGVVRVRGGTLDDTSWLRPTGTYGLRPTRHIWARRKQPCVQLPEDDEVFEGQSA
ncbi:MAG: GFA family protein [Alphaproteobacteria bacterium]|nr:GFA family protein [Alphaproteobacteria bacterium]